MTLPDNWQALLYLLTTDIIFLGLAASALLGGLFRLWEASYGPIPNATKSLVANLAPLVVAAGAWGAGAALGLFPFTAPAAAAALYTGIKAAVGAQLMFAGLKWVATRSGPVPADGPQVTGSSAVSPDVILTPTPIPLRVTAIPATGSVTLPALPDTTVTYTPPPTDPAPEPPAVPHG